MIRISIEVRRRATRFNVSVQAQSIERALQIVQSQHPANHCEVSFPIDAEAFFVDGGSVANKSEASEMVAA